MGYSLVPKIVMMVLGLMIVPTGFVAYEQYHSITVGVLAAVAMPVFALVTSWGVLIACIAASVPPAIVLFWCLNRLGFWPQDRVDGLTSAEERATGDEGLGRLARVLVGGYAVAICLLGYLAYIVQYEVAAQIFGVIVAIAGIVVGTCAGLVGMVKAVEFVIARRERMPSKSSNA